VTIVPRAGWGAAAARSRTSLRPSRVRLLVLHHTTGVYVGPQTVRTIQEFHQGPQRKWADIGYNFLVAPDGTIFEGRGWSTVGAHARGRNSESVGVAFIGDGSRVVPLPAQRSIVWLAEEADRRFGRLQRVGHRDVGSTACPGQALYDWWVRGAFLAEPREGPSDAVSGDEGGSGVVTLGAGELAAERISEPQSPVPNIRSGWLREMGRRGWLRRR